ncbi:MAG: tryptophan--tRNA ligase [Bacilli bacterium]|nr:tryptophan--tRNA ligase [Bacilli bacterium]
MARILSGVKPTGKMTLGNYIGSFRNFPSFQEDNESYIFVADIHALTLPIDPANLRSTTYDVISFYLAAGLDPNKTVLFKQSDIKEVAVLNSILINYIYMGELSRMTQFKAKSAKLNQKKIGVGLFAYPVLMAADIFMYDAEIVPVGDDQIQHVELAHDIAKRFNSRYNAKLLSMPKSVTPKVGKRIMSLQDPLHKMSKSDDPKKQKGVIYLQDSEKDIRKKIMSAITDSEAVVRFDPEKKPGISNLLSIYCAMKKVEISDAEKTFNNCNYGVFKKAVADAVMEEIGPFQKKFFAYRSDEKKLDEIFEQGAIKARQAASVVLERVKKAVGLK